jgi:hypothetical protein
LSPVGWIPEKTFMLILSHRPVSGRSLPMCSCNKVPRDPSLARGLPSAQR